jgi:hypothetical protein
MDNRWGHRDHDWRRHGRDEDSDWHGHGDHGC